MTRLRRTMSRATILTLVTTILWSSQAHAATTQGNLPIVVLASSQQVTCDIGPPATVPAEAAAAGFTHCVANFDFSRPEYATLSDWFDCDGSNPNVLWHSGSAGVPFVNPCNIHQKLDAVANQNVMNFEWLTKYDDNGYNQAGIYQANQVGGQTFNNWTGSSTLTVGNYYVETVNRVEGPVCVRCPPSSGGPNDVYMWGYYGTPDGGGLEVDVNESNTIGFAAGNCSGCANSDYGYWTSWGPNQSRLPSGYSVFDYHTYGALLTSDGATNKYVCMWVDHTLQNDSGCQIAGYDYFDNRSSLLASAGSNAGTATRNIAFDVQYISVWSCDAYQASMCNGTTLVTGDNGLTYWY
jgi:hypothetical protein